MNLAYEMRSVVRFADCDAAGIHFFPRYLERVNQCVEEWFAGPLRCSFRTLHLEQRVGVPTAKLSVEFKAPSRLEDELSYRLHVVKVGRTSVHLNMRVVCGDQHKVEIRQTLVFVDLATMKAKPWPDDLRARMMAFLSDAVEGGNGVRVLLPEGWPRPKGYANGVEAQGRLVFVAGQIGWDAQGRFAEGFAAQVRRTLENTLAVLAEAGAGPEHVARMTWYVVDRDEYLASLREIGAIWRELMGGHYPAMAVVQVTALMEAAARVEIETTAVV